MRLGNNDWGGGEEGGEGKEDTRDERCDRKKGGRKESADMTNQSFQKYFGRRREGGRRIDSIIADRREGIEGLREMERDGMQKELR